MQYNVKFIRTQGLTCRWARTRLGAPIIAAMCDRGVWYVIDAPMWKRAEVVGIKQAFEEYTAFGEFFSVPA